MRDAIDNSVRSFRGVVRDRARAVYIFCAEERATRRLAAEPAPETFAHITQLLRRVKEELKGALPAIVFAGAPFTVATYCIDTGKDLAARAIREADASSLRSSA